MFTIDVSVMVHGPNLQQTANLLCSGFLVFTVIVSFFFIVMTCVHF